MARFDVTTLGEGGLRLSVPSGTRLMDADQLDVHVVGSEANVVSSLSNLGWSTSWLSAVHASAVGERVIRGIARHGVDLSAVRRPGEGRTGIYMVGYAESPRPTIVNYDRDQTCFATMTPDDVDWSQLLDSRLVFCTGLSAGLGKTPREIVASGIDQARVGAIPVAFDVNYRSNLWSPSEAGRVLRPLIEGVELLFCSEADARDVLGAKGTAGQVLQSLQTMSDAAYVFMSMADRGVLCLLDGQITEQSAESVSVIDRLGAGDGLAAGVIHGWLRREMDLAPVYGVVMASLALTQHGEQVLTTAEELSDLVRDRSARLKR